MTVLTVGSGKQFATLKAAVAAAASGDTIEVQAGTYTNDFVYINKALTIRGVDGMAHFMATVPPSNGKGIFTTNADVVLENIELSGAKVADRNGAGVRVEGGTLTVQDCYIHHNEDGILSGKPTEAVIIRNSEFAFNGAGDGYSHNIYVHGGLLDISDSYFHDAKVGHEIKSRALVTTITDSRILDLDGTASYSIDLPNGGTALLRGNVIEQGRSSENPGIVSFGAEGNHWPGSSLTMIDNVIVNDLGRGTGVRNYTASPMVITGTDVYGLTAAQFVSGAAQVSGTTMLATRPELDTSSPWLALPPVEEPAAPHHGIVLGSGADTLELRVSEDAFRGDAQMTVLVDGIAYGGRITVDAAHASGASDLVTIRGDWGPGAHQVSVSFVNDLWEPGVGDRNLYVDGISFNGEAIAGATAAMHGNGTQAFAFDNGPAPVGAPHHGIVLGSGADALELRVSEDAFRGDAQMTVLVDGVAYGGRITVDAAHARGESDAVTVRGDWGPGAHQVSVSFVNDLWEPGVGDRNLYVDGISFNGEEIAGATAAMHANGTRAFAFDNGPTPAGAPHHGIVLGSGAGALELRVSEDAFRGDAQMTVLVDGVAYGGRITVDAAHASGTSDLVTIRGDWGAGPHQVSVGFVNDLWEPGVGDRNLYVDGISFNGEEIAGATAAMHGNGTQTFTFADHSPIA